MSSSMDSSSSNNRRKRKYCNEEEDRISNLPDAILGDILSSFPTTDAVCTSVLSKRWKYVWTSVPCIDIDDKVFISKDYVKCRNPVVKGRFVDFVDRVLRLNGVSRLQKCHLVCRERHERFRDWIRALTTRDLEQLRVENLAAFGLESDSRFELPPSLFTCKKLVVLELTEELLLNPPKSVCLPSLKIIRLVRVKFYDDNSMKSLLAGCPVLEELDMERDCDDNVKTLHIQSSSLKSFRLEIDESLAYENLGMVLDAKNLERLDISDCSTEQFDVHSLSSLVSVQLNLYLDFLESGTVADGYMELLSKMCSTKIMKLSFLTMISLEFTTLDNLPMFHNLTHLVVKIMGSSSPVLPYLLECSPNLKTFEFNLEFTDVMDEVEFRTPECLMLHLESINITGFSWSQSEMEMVGYFLKNSTVLRKLSIYAQKESNLCKELFMLPKASTTCELEIFSCNNSQKNLLPLSHSYQV